MHVGIWEDSAKFLGILGWTAFLLRTAHSLLTESTAAQTPSQAGGASRSAR